jgi:exodeoxyribonuclease-3
VPHSAFGQQRHEIATYNVNGINSRLPRLLEWLEEASPHVACLQELKTSDATFPETAIRDAGYGADGTVKTGSTGVAILAKGSATRNLAQSSTTSSRGSSG